MFKKIIPFIGIGILILGLGKIFFSFPFVLAQNTEDSLFKMKTGERQKITVSPDVKYIQLKQDLQQKTETFQSARENFLNIQKQSLENKNLPPSESIVNRGKDFLTKGVEVATNYLNMLENRIEASPISDDQKTKLKNDLKEENNKWQSLRGIISGIKTRSQLKEYLPTLKEEWQKARRLGIYVSRFVLLNKIKAAEKRLENVLAKIEEKTALLKKHGADTTRLEELISNIKGNLNLVKDKISKLEGIISQLKSTDITSELLGSARDLLREIKQNLRETFKLTREAIELLRENLRELRLKRAHKVIAGTGFLEAKGTGRILAQGSGKIEARKEEGGNIIVLIKTTATSLNINTYGQGSKEEIGEKWIKYSNLNQISIEGENLEVIIRGNNFYFKGEGSGRVLLTGQGSYRTGKDQDFKEMETSNISVDL